MSTASSFDGAVRKPKGAVLFTGPDGVSDYKTNVQDQYYVGHGSMSTEATSDTLYLTRAATGCPHPPPKTARVGEIGWGVPRLSDNSLLKSGDQIKLKEFRQAVEDRHTHLYQTPYYPPSSATQQGDNKKTPRSQERGSKDNLSTTSQTSEPSSEHSHNVH